MEKEKESEFVTHYQQEVRIGKVYSHFNKEIKRVEEKHDTLLVLVKVLETSLTNIDKNTSKIPELIKETQQLSDEKIKETNKRIDDANNVISALSDRNKTVAMWLSFIGVIATPIITGLFFLAPHVYK